MNPIVQTCADKVGGIGKLAELLGVKHQSFYSWREIPAKRVLDIERVTGVPRHELRPDIFPAPAEPAPAAAAG